HVHSPSPCWLADIRILVADDNAINRRLMENLLGNYGATIICVEDGKQAVEALQIQKVDIALIDIHMPVLNGFEATIQIRQLPQGKDLPLIAMTADAMSRNCVEIEHSGFDGYLVKPFEESDLLAAIDHFLHQDGIGKRIHPHRRKEHSTDASELPIYNKPQAMRITGNSASIAMTMLNQFIDTLPSSIKDISNLADRKDWKSLWQCIHKLQGAAAVCAVPAFSAALNRLQVAVQNENVIATETELKLVTSEMQRLINYHAEQEYQPDSQIDGVQG
ncbi:MAG TPA: response regulator, partial [Thiolapillus brandeum]|nr:response regulator [Thiolapillus brandeum]